MDDVLVHLALDYSAYPLWMYFGIESLKQTGQLKKALPSFQESEGELFAPVFTDKDLAERFLREKNTSGQCRQIDLMPAEDLGRLCYLLTLYLHTGVKYAGIDFSTRTSGDDIQRGRLRKISTFLEKIEKYKGFTP
jgi:hypothetical protein